MIISLIKRAKRFRDYEGLRSLGTSLLKCLAHPHQVSPGFLRQFYRHQQAEIACLEEYEQWQACNFDPAAMRFRIGHGWAKPVRWESGFGAEIIARLDNPIILLGKGGGGSRLLGLAAQDCGIFIGNQINKSNDSLEMASAIYQGIARKASFAASKTVFMTVSHLRLAAAQMLKASRSQAAWGFKLPESLLLLPEIDQAFPHARYVHLFPNLLVTCLREPHLTAQPSNPIGRICLRQAYQDAGIDPEQAATDPTPIRMAYTTLHQIGMMNRYCRAHFGPERYYEFNFDELLKEPATELSKLARWLGTRLAGNRLIRKVKPARAQIPGQASSELKDQVLKILEPLCAEKESLNARSGS